jgi:hypothetical protein
METLTLAEFDERVTRAADKMVSALKRFNQKQPNPEAALCSADDLRAEFIEHFRKLLSSEIAITAGKQVRHPQFKVGESTKTSTQEEFAVSKK